MALTRKKFTVTVCGMFFVYLVTVINYRLILDDKFNVTYIQPVIPSDNRIKYIENLMVTLKTNKTLRFNSTNLLYNSPECEIPDYDMYHISVREFIKPPKPVTCSTEFPEVTEAVGSILYLYPHKFPSRYRSQFVNNPNFPKFKNNLNNNTKSAEKNEIIKCCYQAVERITQTWLTRNRNSDTRWTTKNYCTDIAHEETKISFEIILVTCKVNSTVVYTNVHSFIQRYKVEDKLKRWKLESNLDTNKSNREKLKVILIGTDSVSRLNFHRQNTKTLQFLKSNNAIEFFGYNKVAENTFPNMVAVLMGMTVKELEHHKCLKHQKSPKVLDNCKFVWNKFSENKFITAVADDTPTYGIFSTHQYSEFLNPPSDYYGKPYFLAVNEACHFSERWWNSLCLGNQFSVERLYHYGLEFAKAFLNESTFKFLWSTTMTHDYVNGANLIDDFHLDYLTKLKNVGSFDNTILIFMSDHGLRFGDIRKTFIGAMEDRLPYLFMVLPKWFKNRYPNAFNNLNINSRTLISSFDIHETLMDLAEGRFEPTTSKKNNSRGISLMQEISKTRTCAEAGISENFCTCLSSNKMEPDDASLKDLPKFLKVHLNEILKPFPLCLSFEKIKINYSYKVNQSGKKKGQLIFIQVTASPGEAHLDGAIEIMEQQKKFKVIGDLSRINQYGNQSHCIDHTTIMMYCICSDTLPYLTRRKNF